MDVRVREDDGDVILEFYAEDGKSVEVSTRAFYTTVYLNRQDPIEKTKELFIKVSKILGEEQPEISVRREEDPSGHILNPWVANSEGADDVWPLVFEVRSKGGVAREFTLLVPVRLERRRLREILLKVFRS
ncbi:hypothetical protein [Methanopyrus kandleri]